MNKLPLSGLRILVTRSRHQAGQLSNKLAEFGAEPIVIPVIEIGPPDSWEQLDTALDSIADYDWVLFASVNAVDAFLDRLESFGRSTDELARLKLAAIGPSTSDALAKRGLKAAFQPKQFIAEAMVAQFPGYPNLQEKRFLWPRTNIGRGYIIDKLSEAGAQIDSVPAYTTSEPEDAEWTAKRLVNLLVEKKVEIVTLASAQSATNLAKLLHKGLELTKSSGQPSSLSQLLSGVKVATIGPETSKAAVKVLGKSSIEAAQSTISGLVDAIVKHAQEGKH
jgi:uroporphyrinogen III methyltransferase/synthase